MRSIFFAFYAAYGRVMTFFATTAGAVLFGVMWLIAANSISRKLFNAPILGSLEITEALMPFVILLPMAYTQMRNGHIRVTLLTDRLPYQVARILHAIFLLIAALFFAWVTYATAEFALRAFRLGETAWGLIRIPLWPSKFVITVGSAMLALQFLLDAVKLGVLGASAQEDEIATLIESEREAAHG